MLRDKIIDANRAYRLEPSLKETQKQNNGMQEEVIKFRLKQHPLFQQADKLMDAKRKHALEGRLLGVKPDNARIWFGKNYRRM